MEGAKENNGHIFYPLIDGHVHIYNCYDVPRLLESSFHNFKKGAQDLGLYQDYIGILLLCESNNYDWFEKHACGGISTAGNGENVWSLQYINDISGALVATSCHRKILILPGRQIRTREGLEVLALITAQKFDDGLPLEKLIDRIHVAGAIPVIPWAVGKWLGRRGRILENFLQRSSEFQGVYYLGDNGGRPEFWRNPRHFALAREHNINILPGSDPLPLPWDAARTGSFGFALRKTISLERPASDLYELLRNGHPEIRYFGCLENTARFMRNQMALRFRGGDG